jgi:hypothetical protein
VINATIPESKYPAAQISRSPNIPESKYGGIIGYWNARWLQSERRCADMSHKTHPQAGGAVQAEPLDQVRRHDNRRPEGRPHRHPLPTGMQRCAWSPLGVRCAHPRSVTTMLAVLPRKQVEAPCPRTLVWLQPEPSQIDCGVRITLVFRAAFTAKPLFDMHVLLPFRGREAAAPRTNLR